MERAGSAPGFADPIPDVAGRGAAGAIGGIAVVAAGCGAAAEGTSGAIGPALAWSDGAAAAAGAATPGKGFVVATGTGAAATLGRGTSVAITGTPAADVKMGAGGSTTGTGMICGTEDTITEVMISGGGAG